MTIITRRQSTIHAPCALPHHRPGSRVSWDRWSNETNRITRIVGIVVAHEGRVITARCEPDGRLLKTSCGCVGPA